MSTKTLNQLLIEEFGRQSITNTHMPLSITGNINPKFPVREYQEKAFKFFITYYQNSFIGKPRNTQLLFHMATGSGKTLIMAGLIAYLYEKGYRNFLFFVNSNNIINKTKDNFLNPQSPKYLFSDSISFGDKRVNIREVDNFQSSNLEDINIIFTTIQGLHADLNTPRENKLTYDDFEQQKIVLLSDEAHHINADTKKGKIDNEELYETVSWEGTVERIYKSNPENVLLEFTATVDFTDVNIQAKYNPRILFDYPLKEFRKDGYSKEVKVIQTDLPPFKRALQAVLFSQYRRKIFEKNKKLIKPVILFKSRKIKESQAFFEEFIVGIKNLTVEDLLGLRDNSSEHNIRRFFDYLNTNNISLDNLINELKDDFSREKLIEVNSKEESELKQLAVNSLEVNEYRAVFAVDKLNEGWDVLNLFDIVRLYDTRDAKANKVGKTTMSEAQLIGRGARYCPFQLTEEQPNFVRKYDSDLDNELRICEELFYHSAYNPKYIQELNSALQELGITAKKTIARKMSLKSEFKSTDLFKAGHIFLNERQKYSREDLDGLDGKLTSKPHKVSLYTGISMGVLVFDSPRLDIGIDKTTKDYSLLGFGESVVRKAIQQIEFYEFDNLKHYLPNLKSIHEFITSERYLGKVCLEVSGTTQQVNALSADDKLDAAVQVLTNFAEVIVSDKVEYKGTKLFKPNMINAVFSDKTLNFAIDEGSDKEFGKSMIDPVETAYYLDLASRSWYVYDDCFGTSEEKLLIHYIEKQHDELAALYSGVYLLRNEKHFTLYAFDDGSPFEPDFILYLIGKEALDTKHYQVIIEPKGGHLISSDKWKEDFLLTIKQNGLVEQLFSNKEYILWGLPFYNAKERTVEFEESFRELGTS